MTAYDRDLAFIHDDGYTHFAHGSAPGLIELLHKHKIEDGLVVDLGCGSGVWANVLVESGYDVEGVDISGAMIEIARKRVPAARFHVDSFLKFKFPKCRAVTALGEVFNYLFDKQHRGASLRRLCTRIHRALEPGGLLIFDVAEPTRNLSSPQHFKIHDDWVCLVEYEHDQERAQLTRHITTFRQAGRNYRRHQETHRLQLFRAREVSGMLRELGFRVRTLRSYGDFSLHESTAAFVARKID